MRRIADMLSMQGRVAVITGGGGHIGRAMAEALAECGCAIVLADRNDAALREASCTLAEQFPQIAVAAESVDLENEAERESLAKRVHERFGRLDVLINNAGFVGDTNLQGWVAPFGQQSMATWRRAMEVNVGAAFHLSQLLAPALKASGKGSILNVGSIYGVVGPDMGLYEGTAMGNPAAYSASKGAVVQMTRWLSAVLAPEIRVNCISPGGVARNQPPTFVDRYVARTPLRRMGREEDLKGATIFFASDLSGWVTGENLMVDGGWTVW